MVTLICWTIFMLARFLKGDALKSSRITEMTPGYQCEIGTLRYYNVVNRMKVFGGLPTWLRLAPESAGRYPPGNFPLHSVKQSSLIDVPGVYIPLQRIKTPGFDVKGVLTTPKRPGRQTETPSYLLLSCLRGSVNPDYR